MMLTVTRPIEQAVMEVPGIRRVRSRSIRGAAEISAQFDPATDMVVALQQVQNRVAEMRGDLPADAVLTVERLTPAVFPVLILSMTGNLATADLNDLATYVVKPELARVPGAGHIEVLASDTREVEVVLDPARLTAANLTVTDVADALRAQNLAAAGGPLRRRRASSISRWRRGCGRAPTRSPSAPVVVKGGATMRVADLGTVVPGAPDRTLLVTGNGRDAVSISISQQIGANILAVKQGVDAALASAHARAARPASASPRSTTWRSSSARRSPTCATPSSSAALLAIVVLLAVPARRAADAHRGGDAAAGHRARRSSSCRCSAARST